MDSRLSVVAVYRRGQTVVESIRSSGVGHFAGRQTGPGEIHLVGTAAGPLGGDRAVIDVHVGPGASLRLRSAGATIVQPGRVRPDSVMELNLRVDDEAELDLATEPTVVCLGAEHENRTTLALSGTGRARLVEQVLLGRAYEGPGRWSGRTVVTRDGSPVLRHTLRSALTERVVSTLFRSEADGRPVVRGTAVAMPLASGGLLVTATGTDLIPVHADLVVAEAEALAAASAPTPVSSVPSSGRAG